MNPRNFLYWTIGFQRTWPVRCEASELPATADGRLHRWGQIVDGQRLTFHVERKAVPLSFPNPAMAREVRQVLQHTSTPLHFRLKIEQDPEREGWWAGDLELVQTSLPASIEDTLGIVLPDTLWKDLPEAERKRRQITIQGALTFECGGRPTLVAEAPLFSLEPEQIGSRLDLVLDDRRRLPVRIEGVPGQQWLVVEALPETRGSPEVKGGRLITLRREPVFASSAEQVPRADLTPLVPPVQELLRAWLQYEGFERVRDQELFERRNSAPLDFNDAYDADQQSFDVAIVNTSAARQWTERGDLPGGKLNIDVQVSSLGPAEPPRPATLERFIERREEGRFFARLRFDSEADRPPSMGRLLPVENAGSAAARKRRQVVIEQLRTGRFGNPRLLEYLLDPGRVPPVTFKRETFLRNSRKKSLEERQLEAVAKVAKLPELLLIQGPPGTGKTEVLVQIVHELQARYGGRQEAEGVKPFRILIAGAHNEAVRNAFGRLEGLVVRVVTAEQQQQDSLAEQSALRGQEIAKRARERIEGRATFQHIQALKDLHEWLTLARRIVIGHGVEEARPRLDRLAIAETGRLLSESHLRELQRLVGRIDALPRAEDPAQASGGVQAALASALHHVLQVPLAGVGESPEPLLSPLAALETAWNAAMQAQAPVPDELLQRASEWISLKPRIEQVVRRGESWSAALHGRAAGLRAAETAGPASPPDSGEGTLSVRQEALRHLEHDAIRWCDEALRLVGGQLAQLRRTEEVVIDEWIRRLEEDPRLFHQLQSRHAPIAAATCQKAADTIDANDTFYDVVIVDEAARAGIDVLIPMALGKHVILVGDHRQLPPYVEEQLWRQLDMELQERVDMESSLFAWLHERLPKENFIALDKQFRMHEEIGRLISKAFYEPGGVELRHYWEGERARDRLLDLGLFKNKPTVWVDTNTRPDKEQDCVEVNPYELQVITKLLEAIPQEKLELLHQKHGKPPIALLAFYVQQKNALKEWLDQQPSWLRESVEVSTVQTVQGREFPLVIIATTRSTRAGKVGFLKEESSANVAISRAQSQVIIVGDSKTLAAEQRGRGSPPWRRVHGLMSQTSSEAGEARSIIPAEEVLKWTP